MILDRAECLLTNGDRKLVAGMVEVRANLVVANSALADFDAGSGAHIALNRNSQKAIERKRDQREVVCSSARVGRTLVPA